MNGAARLPARTALAAALGAFAGAASAAFLAAYEAARFWPAATAGRSPWALAALVAAPALGGLACGWVVERFEPAARGTGTPELLHAVRGHGARFGARYASWKTLASLFTTLSGGSAGPEAPMVTFGAGFAASAARRLGVAPRAVRVLTAAGAAAGFAAVFDAPAAGAVFASEVLLREAGPESFLPVAAAAVAGVWAARLLLGPREGLEQAARGAALRSPRELAAYAVLAALAGLFGKLFIEVAVHLDKLLEKAVRRPSLRAATGGLALGVLGLALPQALGNSHHDLPALFAAQAALPLAAGALAFLLFGKMLACPLTVGSGGSGGIFIPYLMMGAALGALLSGPARALVPGAGPAAGYMVAGMGGVFAAVTLAPATALVLVLELTRAWGEALPLSLVVLGAYATARAVGPESLDARKLKKRGVTLHPRVPDWELDAPASGA